jgi:hypothetical protein
MVRLLLEDSAVLRLGLRWHDVVQDVVSGFLDRSSDLNDPGSTIVTVTPSLSERRAGSSVAIRRQSFVRKKDRYMEYSFVNWRSSQSKRSS